MASASELWDSRVGDTSADRQGFSATRLHYVKVDAIGDNADDVLRDIDAVGADVAIPFKTPHPTRSELQSAFYTVDRRLSAFEYVVRTVYAPPLDFTTPTNPWELSFQVGLATVAVNHDFFDRAIGSATYKIRDINEPAGRIYRVTSPADQDNPPESMQLVRIDGTDDEPVNHPIFLSEVQRTEPVGSFSMTRTFAAMDELTMASLVNLANIVNKGSFYGFRPRTIKFLGPSANAGVGTIPDTGSSGFVWRITLAFEWNANGYRLKAQDVFDFKGQKLAVTNEDGSDVIREWQLYAEGNLENIPPMVMAMSSYINRDNLGIVIPTRSAGRPRQIGGGG